MGRKRKVKTSKAYMRTHRLDEQEQQQDRERMEEFKLEPKEEPLELEEQQELDELEEQQDLDELEEQQDLGELEEQQDLGELEEQQDLDELEEEQQQHQQELEHQQQLEHQIKQLEQQQQRQLEQLEQQRQKRQQQLEKQRQDLKQLEKHRQEQLKHLEDKRKEHMEQHRRQQKKQHHLQQKQKKKLEHKRQQEQRMQNQLEQQRQQEQQLQPQLEQHQLEQQQLEQQQLEQQQLEQQQLQQQQLQQQQLQQQQLEQQQQQQKVFIDPVDLMENGKFVFKHVPEVPVFYPTMDEFKDPLKYIAQIRSVGEKYGICKIKPPTNWRPPFCVDVDNFKFTPRVQKLNELDGLTRIKLNFTEQIVKYWNLQGICLKIFDLEHNVVDIYSLYRIVELEGGFDEVCSEEKWNLVAARMGFVNIKLSGAMLHDHYEKWIKPFVIFLAFVDEDKGNQSIQIEENKAIDIKKEDSSSEPNVSTKQNSCSSCADKNNTVIRRPVGRPRKNACSSCSSLKCKTGPKTKISKVKKQKFVVKIQNKCCQKCGSGKFKKAMLICNLCKFCFHKSCIIIPSCIVRKSKFVCHKCIVSKVIVPDDDFGFEDAERDYTLQQFGEYADHFKSNYFNMPVQLVPNKKIEQEYWKIVSSIDSTLTTEYGCDISTADFGSGFPKNPRTNRNDYENSNQSYTADNWNLNNISILKDSIFNFINTDISGMKLPWLYVSMCFSTFCWHNEDHWTYSINYLHWGESKTWYAVPGGSADIFEETMRGIMPELFQLQPDLLNQLVTTLNPNILMKANVPVYGIDQYAGEFIITFPRSYHMGFSHGFNCGEAVNFISPDWIPIGRKCINHYSSLKQMCVFSQDELILNIINFCEDLTPQTARYVYKDFMEIVKFEKINRKELLTWGVKEADFIQFEHEADDYRQCIVCNTTIYVSAVACSCDIRKLTCLRHFKQHCSCPPASHIFKYRFTLDEFSLIRQMLKRKLGSE